MIEFFTTVVSHKIMKRPPLLQSLTLGTRPMTSLLETIENLNSDFNL